MLDTTFLSTPQLDAILRSVIAMQSARLDRVAAAAKTSAGFDAAEAVHMDRLVGWAYRLLDARGADAVVRAEDRQAMLAVGLTEADVAFVDQHLAILQANRMVPTPREKLARLVEEQGAQPSAMNLASAQQMYFRGMALASFNNAGRYRGVVPDARDIIAAALHIDRSPPTRVLVPAPEPAQALPPPTLPTEAPAEPVKTSTIDDGVVAVGERLISVKKKDENWDTNTQDQARQTFDLLDRFLKQECKVEGLAQLRQQHASAFVDFLRNEIYKFYGKSPRDKTRTIAELRKIAADKPPATRGIVGGTLNRHIGNIEQLLGHARARGITVDRDIDLSGLRGRKPKNTRARDERPKMPTNVMKQVFAAPPYVGCADWDRPYDLQEGGPVFHRALYFVPMMLNYMGGRREEFCGLAIDDIVLDAPIPYVHIRPNEFRRIKNPQSIRKIPLHRELNRLLFPEYVGAIAALGYKRVFPDLYSPTTNSPMGDRFYDEFMPVLQWACKQLEVKLKYVLHSIRHGFNSQLKDADVSDENRGDLLGHIGNSETTERYAEPIALQKSLEIISKLPNVTSHLEPHPVKLLPWVERHKVAPFSRGKRRS